MLLQTTSYFLILLGIFAVLLLAGLGLVRLLRLPIERPATLIFSALALGLTLAVATYSVLRTHGITVNVGLFLLAALAMVFFRSTPGVPSPPHVPSPERGRALRALIAELGLVIGAIFLMQAYSVYNSGTSVFLVPQDPDRTILTDVAHFISASGKESSQLDYLHASELGSNPYHYFELWMTAEAAAVSGKLDLVTDHLITAPLIGGVVYAGMRAVADSFGVPWLAQVLVCFLLTVFNAEVQLPVLKRIGMLGRTEEYYNLSAIEYPKVFTLYMYELLAILLSLARRPALSALSLAAMTVTNILAVPAIIPGSLVGVIIARWRKSISSRELVRIAGVMGVVSAFLFLFYRFFGRPPAPSGHSGGLHELLLVYRNPAELKTSVNIIAASAIQSAYVLSPYVVLAAMFRREILAFFKSEAAAFHSLALMALGCASGLAAWSLIHYQLESHQLFVRFAHVTFNLAALLLFCAVFKARTKPRVAWTFLIALFVLKAGAHAQVLSDLRMQGLTGYSPKFIEQVEAASHGLNPIGVYFKDVSEYVTTRDKRPTVRPGHYLGVIDSRFYPNSLTVFDAPISPDPAGAATDEAGRASSAFYQFVESQKSGGKFVDVAQSQLDFLDQEGVQYGILSKAALLPSRIAPRVRRLIKDEVSGERFVVF